MCDFEQLDKTSGCLNALPVHAIYINSLMFKFIREVLIVYGFRLEELASGMNIFREEPKKFMLLLIILMDFIVHQW